jgi:hypothetical protein
MFAMYGMPILAGRAFNEADTHPEARVVIINHVFAERVFGDGRAIGRRVRVVNDSRPGREADAGPWLEIVGVVRDFASYETKGIYQPADIARLSSPINLTVRVRTRPPMGFAPQLRAMAAAIDPDLQLDNLRSAAEAHGQGRQFMRYVTIATTSVTMSVLLLSAAGIYAMMSFTVARRRREIGIRSALGADARKLLGGVFARASRHISAGIFIGVLGTIALDRMAGRGPVRDGDFGVIVLVSVLMTTTGLLATIGPARRGLSIQPTEALREE